MKHVPCCKADAKILPLLAGVNEKKKKAKVKRVQMQVTLKAQIYLTETSLEDNVLQGAAVKSTKKKVGWLLSSCCSLHSLQYIILYGASYVGRNNTGTRD